MFSQQATAYLTRFELYTVSLGQCVQAGLFDALPDDVVSRVAKKRELYHHLIAPDEHNHANGLIDA